MDMSKELAAFMREARTFGGSYQVGKINIPVDDFLFAFRMFMRDGINILEDYATLQRIEMDYCAREYHELEPTDYDNLQSIIDYGYWPVEDYLIDYIESRKPVIGS